MRLASLSIAAAAAVATLAPPRAAAADGTYGTFGFGSGEVSDQLGDHTDDLARFKLGVGHRFGNLALEGFVAGEIPDWESDVSSASEMGVDLKYLVKLSDHWQGYVRGSASRMDLTLGGGGYNECYDCYSFGRDYSGRGLGGGAGVMLRGKVRAIGFLYWPLFFVPAGPKVNASIYFDHGMDFYRLHPDDGTATIDAKITRWTFGFTVGQDF